MSDGVAGEAVAAEDVFSTVKVEWTIVSGSLLIRQVCVLEIIQELANHARLECRVVQGRTAYPLASGLIADQEAGQMPVGIYGWIVPQPKPLAEEVDVLLLAREEGPAWTNVKFLHVG